MPITDPAQEYFKDGAWGWDGSQWRKLPLVWGYSEQYVECQAAVVLSDGHYECELATVPPGEVWVVTNIHMMNRTAACSVERAQLVCGEDESYIVTYLPTAALDACQWQGFLVMVAGQYIKCTLEDCVTGDEVRVNVHGYKLKVS